MWESRPIAEERAWRAAREKDLAETGPEQELSPGACAFWRFVVPLGSDDSSHLTRPLDGLPLGITEWGQIRPGEDDRR